MSAGPTSLLGLPVRHRGLRLGTVSEVLLARDGVTALALVVSSAWGGARHVLPVGAATIHDDRVDASPFALLSETEAAYYRGHGSVRLGERRGRARV